MDFYYYVFTAQNWLNLFLFIYLFLYPYEKWIGLLFRLNFQQ